MDKDLLIVREILPAKDALVENLTKEELLHLKGGDSPLHPTPGCANGNGCCSGASDQTSVW